MNYGFDDNGNLAFREDSLTHQNESFQYDALNRLEQISYEFDGYPISAGNLSLTYEDGGNISSKSDLANTIVYGDGTAGPHALTSIGDLNTAYLPSDQTISYTNFNKVSSISQLDENADPINLTYTYGLDRQRIKTVFTRDALTEKTKYFLGDYEEVTTSSGTKKYHYISGGTGLCAIFVIDDQDNDTLFYTLNDHLGSLAGVINAETDAVAYFSYDAWGNPRDNDDWTTKTDADLFADRGFTGHEHLIEFGLIDMNGRVYDPMLGRFLSPDPYVQMPGYADNFNRYSYCLNNPLVYTDPSGEFFWIPFAIGAAIGSYSGYQIGKAHGAQGFSEWAGYIGGGALIGGLSGGAAAGISAAGGGAMLAGAAAGAVGGAGFNGLASGWDGQAMLRGAKYGAIAGLVGGGVGSLIGGGWGALAGGSSSNLTNQLLYNNGDFGDVNWGSVGISGLTSLGIYHGISYSNWKWGGGKNFGDVELTYKAYNKLNALYTRSRFIRRELSGAILEDGSFQRIFATESTETSMRFNKDDIPANTKYLVHTHYPTEGWPVNVNGRLYAADPYKPSDPTDYLALEIAGLNEGMILTNKSLLNYHVNGLWSNNWAYPSLRYTPLYWWFNLGR